ncbi:hypothetical protein RB195_026308 [Necator americanus]|uniref:Reverse transcriptase domain-containing protein n=1 Tax=Necator americanus TaxID=51031 RepID=A0ABR1EWV4_NECAM
MRRCGPTPALTIFVAYDPTSSCEEEDVEAFYMDLEKFCREDHAFYKVIIGDFNAKIGPRRAPGDIHIGIQSTNYCLSFTQSLQERSLIGLKKSWMKDRYASKQKVSREYNMQLCLTFIDLKKAFDTVETEAVMEALYNQTFPTPYIKMLRELYSNFTTKISSLYNDIVIDMKRELNLDKAMLCRQLHHLCFADDIALITTSISDGERMLDTFDETYTWAFRKQEENAVNVAESAVERVMLGVFRVKQVRNGIRNPLSHQGPKIRDAAAFTKGSKKKGRPPTQWSDFFTKSIKENNDAIRVPREQRNHWATLVRDWGKSKITGARSTSSKINGS